MEIKILHALLSLKNWTFPSWISHNHWFLKNSQFMKSKQCLYSCKGVFIMCKCSLVSGYFKVFRNIHFFDFSLLFVMFSLVRQFRCSSTCCMIVIRSSVFQWDIFSLSNFSLFLIFMRSCNSIQVDNSKSLKWEVLRMLFNLVIVHRVVEFVE